MDAVGLRLGKLSRSRFHDIVRKGQAGRRAAAHLWLPGVLCALLVVVEHFLVLAFEAPTLRAIIETQITLGALAAACLFGLSVGHRRDLRSLLLAGALLQLAVMDFVSYVLQAAIGLRSPGSFTAAPVLGGLFVAVTIIAGASIGQNRQVRPGRKPLLAMVAASLVAAGIAELGGLLLRSELSSGVNIDDHGLSAGIHHPIGSVLAVLTAALLVVAAVRTSRAIDADNAVKVLLGAAMICFAGASVNYLVLPAPGVDWVTAREGVRGVAYALILAAALRQEAAIRRTIGGAAAAAERRRIARDLHDGLAQDLAFIAAHGDRIAREAGDDHPLAVAARRALAVSRGAIADLSAAEASTATAALRQIANELQVRFGVHISVEGDEVEVPPGAREDVVRIVREAIVNAVHASARNIAVSLTRRGERFVLRVLDDGVGIDDKLGARPGFGVRAMRERAASLGGGLIARPVRDGGTELEVMFP